jgi:hypothetical protein
MGRLDRKVIDAIIEHEQMFDAEVKRFYKNEKKKKKIVRKSDKEKR